MIDETNARDRENAGPVSSARPSWDLARIVLAVAASAAWSPRASGYVQPFLPAVIWATMIVVTTWPWLRAVEARLWGKRGLAVAVMTLAMLMDIVVPVAVGVATVVQHSGTIMPGSFHSPSSG